MDWIISNLDTVAKLAAIVIAFVSFFYALRADINSLKHDINSIRESQKALSDGFATLNSILTQIAVQDTRINMIEKDIDEMRHNKGFVN